MKFRNIIAVALTVCFTVSFTACTVVHSSRGSASSAKPLPPGKAKKVNGDKSARNYAPGHNKG
ncbi:hypothetical protein ACLI1A_07105 [Flavobacterium sp. RHBU_3]|uniref:hypothetical protein n=1 Tax=Flavobacterium sp. RHBU_3 TaxID=3391184 RepID=UPI0039852478